MSAEAERVLQERTPEKRCRNCGRVLDGPYCAGCGQKELEPHEYALGHFLHHALHDVTHFDTKLFRSILPLLAQPGVVTADYLAGRRGRYLRPLQTFILINLIFFLFAPRFGLFNFTLHMYENARPLFGVIEAKPLAEAARARSRLSEERFEERFDHVLASQRKALVIVMVVLFAVALSVMFFAQRRYFVEHLIFALHFYAFWLIVILAVPLAILGLILISAAIAGQNARHASIGETALIVGLFAACTIYLAAAVRRVYGAPRLRAWLQGTALAATMLLLIFVYRDLLFFTTLVMV